MWLNMEIHLMNKKEIDEHNKICQKCGRIIEISFICSRGFKYYKSCVCEKYG